MKRNILFVLLSVVIILIAVSCRINEIPTDKGDSISTIPEDNPIKEDNLSNEDNDHISVSPTPIPSNSDEEEVIEVIPEEIPEEVIEVIPEIGPDITNFKSLRDSFINYEFTPALADVTGQPVPYLMEGEYDLDMDGNPDQIQFNFRGALQGRSDTDIYIEINGTREEFYMDYTYDGEVHVIDLDINDNYIEVACFDEGPSGDPCYHFFRYDGTGVFKIGEIDAYALIDGRGNLISSFNISKFTPLFYSSWYTIEEDEFVKKANDINDNLGKTYEFSGGEAFFIPFEEMPESYQQRWEWEEIRHFEPCKIKLIDIRLYYWDSAMNDYYVELPDGEKGMMYFWIGD